MGRCTVLRGGGRGSEVDHDVWGPFLAAAADAATDADAGRVPVVAFVLVDEGDGAEQFQRHAESLTAVAPCSPRPVLVPLGGTLDVGELDGADALFVGGGLTPAYATALAPHGATIRAWLAAGRPYAGFSAGACVAAGPALVGGYRVDGRVVCPPDAGEDLEEVTVTAGLGLLGVAVDVHAAQWGTLGRLVAAVRAGRVARGVALDEDTALVLRDDRAEVTGTGTLHEVSPGAAGEVVVRAWPAGELPRAVVGA